MKGWKTKVGTMLSSVGGVMMTVPEQFPFQHLVGQLLVAIGAPLAAWGIGHKIEKASDAGIIEEVIKESKK